MMNLNPINPVIVDAFCKISAYVDNLLMLNFKEMITTMHFFKFLQ